MTLDIKPLAVRIGALATGIDLREEQDDATIARIREAVTTRGIVLFRNQDITPEQHIAFSKRFGPLDDFPLLERGLHPEYRDIWVVTNVPRGDGSASPTKNTGRIWHTDQSYMKAPAFGSLLHCKEIPPVGGDTMFANAQAAYDDLSDGMKAMIDGLRAVHDVNSAKIYTAAANPDVAVKPRTDEEKAKTPPVVQPVALRHPETGRRAIYLVEDITSHIEGMTAEESRDLLTYLARRIQRPEYTYRHKWEVGDLIFWDNRVVQHLAMPDYDSSDPGNRRVMWRTTVAGLGPFVE